jgi:hypothetical protein
LLSATVEPEPKAPPTIFSAFILTELAAFLMADIWSNSYFVFSLKHSRQSGIYKSAPPISTTFSEAFLFVLSARLCLKVNDALAPHILQIELKFLTFSVRGIRAEMEGQACFRESLLSAEMITIFPRFAASSANSTS